MQKKDYLRTGALASTLLCLLLVGCGPSTDEQAAPSIVPSATGATPPSTPTFMQPNVIKIEPSYSEEGIKVDSVITISFSEQMDESTIDSSSFQVIDAEQDVAIAGSLSFDGLSAIFTPTETLEFSKKYSVVITDSIKDLSGNNLTDSSTSWFKTEDILSTSNAAALELEGFSGGSFISGYAVLDMNSDGLDDLIYGGPKWINQKNGWVNEPAELTVLLNTGDDGFIKGNETIFPLGSPALVHARDAKADDLNGDGIKDILFIGHGYDSPPFPGEENVLLLSQPNGSFIDASNQLDNPVSGFSHSSAIGDIDNDGDVDLIVVDIYGGNANPSVYVLENDGLGQFTTRKIRFSGSSSFKWTASELVDLDNDGLLDLVLGEDGSRSISIVLWNQGDGVFRSAPTELPSADPYFIVADIISMDLNNDGYQDLLLSTTKESPVYEGSYLQVLINNKNKEFSDETPTHFPSQNLGHKWAYRIEKVDLDLDGDFDLVALYDLAESGYTQLIWINDGDGVFSILPLSDPNTRGTMIPIDVDADGDMDFMVLTVPFFGNNEQVQRWTTVLNNTK
jgi:hypothetical protein